MGPARGARLTCQSPAKPYALLSAITLARGPEAATAQATRASDGDA